MIIAKVVLTNFMRFKGVNEVDLEPKIYTITAETSDNPERSNWVGKSSFLEAILFGLYGRRPPRFKLEDEWITRGTKYGSVKICFDDGSSLTRGRHLGKSTKLTFEDGQTSSGDEAQTLIDAKIGLTEDDFLVSCYSEQRQMAKFVLTKPTQRYEIVMGWLQLEKLQEASDLAKIEVSRVTSQIAHYTGQLQALETMVEGLKQKAYAPLAQMASLDQATYECEREIESLKKIIEEELKRFESERASELLASVIVQGKETAAKVQTLKSEDVEGELEHLRAVRVTTDRDFQIIKQENDQLARLASGKFDGICPVMSTTGQVTLCPCADMVKSKKSEYAQASIEKAKEYSKAFTDKSVLDESIQELESKTNALHRVEGELVSLRKRVKELQPLAKQATGEPVTISAHQQKLLAIQKQKTEFECQNREIAEAEKKLELLATQKTELLGIFKSFECQLKAAQEAAMIFGRNGAQRRIAEAALQEIEQGANEILLAANLDLSVKISWTRESQGLAKHCEECGEPFPSSAKVKACSRCKSPRGQEQIQRLEVELSERSGAAEDLAGCAIQLSAASWLRNDRPASWSVALLDECFGQLDAHNRKHFARHLVSMLTGKYGFRQAFVISHSPDTVDLFPGKIQLIGSSEQTMIKVIA